MGHLSSLAPMRFALLNGQTSPDPYVAACFSVGNREDGGQFVPQFSLFDAGQASHGRLVWDADHARNGSDSPFFSVAPVRLDVKSTGECGLAVGTADYVELQARPYRWIERVQVAAVAGTTTPSRALQWDLIELMLHYADGRTETCRSSCLPRVVTGESVRRSAQAVSQAAAPESPSERRPQQYVEIATGCRDVVGLKLRGQVTLRANEGMTFPLRPQDLQGLISVFTDAGSGRG